MMGDTAQFRRLADPAGLLRGRHPLAWWVGHTVKYVLGAEGVSVTFEVSAVDRVTVCATDRRSELLENLHDILGEGPYRDALDSGSYTRAALGSPASALWPRFAPAAAQITGPDAVLWSFPMRVADLVMGAVSVYRLPPGTLAVPAGTAQALADAAADVLLADPQAFAPFTDPGQEGGWSSRAVVHQATGMLAAQMQTSITEALAILRSHALTSGRQLAEIARDITERKLNLSAW